MARTTLEAWIPEEYGSEVLTRINSVSAVERLGRHTPMGSDTKNIARSGGATVAAVAKGAAYGEDGGTNDAVTLNAIKMGTIFRIAEEDIDDSFVDVLSVKKLDWAGSYARYFDNAALAVTAAPNGGTIPFKSVYNALATADASQGYTANANIVKTAGALTYADFVSILGIVEASDFYDEAKTVIIAHPSFKTALRGLLDGNDRPLFSENVRAADPDTLFGLPVVWSNGAKTSATATATPSGNPLLIVGNSDFLIVGDRRNAESVVIDGKDGASAATDETLLKVRARKGFAVGTPQAFGIIEVTAA